MIRIENDDNFPYLSRACLNKIKNQAMIMTQARAKQEC